MSTPHTPPRRPVDGGRPDRVGERLADVSTRLRAAFGGEFDAATIDRVIDDTDRLLRARATVATWLPLLVERVAGDRLRALTLLGPAGPSKPAVLFLCVHNAGRSQMAAGWLRHLVGDRVDVFSAGTEPAAEVHATAIAVMHEAGIDISDELPQPWTDEVADAADVIVSMGCGDACPVMPGKRFEEWELTTPDGWSVDEVRDLSDAIRGRVDSLVAELGLGAAPSGRAS